MTVEQQIEANLSPRCQDTIAYMEAHQGGYVKPTHKPLASHDENRNPITEDDRKELEEFDINAQIRNVLDTGICSNM